MELVERLAERWASDSDTSKVAEDLGFVSKLGGSE